MKKLMTLVVIALFTAGGVVLASAMSRSVMQEPTTVSMAPGVGAVEAIQMVVPGL